MPSAFFLGCLSIALVQTASHGHPPEGGSGQWTVSSGGRHRDQLTPWLAAARARGHCHGVCVSCDVRGLRTVFNRISLRFAAVRIDVSGTAVTSQEVLTTTTISGGIGFPAHLFAILIAMLDRRDRPSAGSWTAWRGSLSTP